MQIYYFTSNRVIWWLNKWWPNFDNFENLNRIPGKAYEVGYFKKYILLESPYFEQTILFTFYFKLGLFIHITESIPNKIKTNKTGLTKTFLRKIDKWLINWDQLDSGLACFLWIRRHFWLGSSPTLPVSMTLDSPSTVK